jgi:hypothetical protein
MRFIDYFVTIVLKYMLLSYINPFIDIIEYSTHEEYANKLKEVKIPNEVPYKETHLERIYKKCKLMSCLPIIDVEKTVDSEYNITIEYSFFIIELIHIFTYIRFYTLKKEIPTTVSSYWQNNNQFFERFYIRLDCLHNGWNPIHIEELFHKYYGLPLNKESIILYMYNILKAILQFREPVLPKGRPKLSNMCKQILKKYYYKNVSKKIKHNNHLSTTLANVFTDLNVGYIKESIQKNDSIPEEDKKTLLSGIDNLKEYTK